MQIERRAYFRIDKVEKIGDEHEYTLFLVPDGKKVGLASIDKETNTKGDIAKEDLADKVSKKKEGKQEKKKAKKEEEKQEAKVEEKQEAKVEEKKEEVTQVEEKK